MVAGRPEAAQIASPRKSNKIQVAVNKFKSRTDQKLAVFTVVSNNYLHFARTLLQTVSRFHPDADIYCIIVDRDLGPSAEYSSEFSVLHMSDLNIPDVDRMAFQYDVLELNTAVKPWAFETLLRRGYESVFYIDPDIFLYQPLGHVVDALQSNFDIVVTPHLLSPILDDKRPTELDIRRAGTYNFGFCAVRNSQNTLRFLRWWQGKLARDCIVDQDRGIFVDQSWIDLVPGLFDNVCILRSPGYNVAYWNLAQRVVAQDLDGTWKVDGEPLAFFHFSGFNPLAPEVFSKHQNRFTLSNLGPAASLALEYAEVLIKNGAKRFSSLPYGYARFSDGTHIPKGFRRLYLQNEALRAQMSENPFGQSNVLTKMAEGPDAVSVLPLTWSMFGIYKNRPDLQQKFDLLKLDGATGYWKWFIAKASPDISTAERERHRDLWEINHNTMDVADLLCFEMFANFLDRNPSQQERDGFRGLCKTRLGATIALFALRRTPENRNLPRPTRRFKRAFSAIWRRRIVRNYQTSTFGSATAQLGQAPSLTGIFPKETGASENGAWCGANVFVPLGNKAHRTIRVSGLYLPSSFVAQVSRESFRLSLYLDGELWKKVDLPESGEIEISEDVPEHFATARVLQIAANRAFLQASIGESTGQREHSWRLKTLIVNDVVLFESGRDQPFLPLAELFRPEGFNLIGYVFAESGVGEAARTMATAADAAAIPYSLYDVGYQSPNRQSDRRAVANAVEKTFAVDLLYVNADQTSNTLEYLSRNGHPDARYKIGFWHWEQPRLPETYWDGFEGLNEIWVPTSFVHQAVSAVSPLPVFKVPHAIDFTVDKGWTRQAFGIPARKFAVLVMYDFASYVFRKNPQAAIAAFKRAALGRTDMTLVIKTINANRHAEEYAALKAEIADLESVVLIDEVYSREQIYALEANCDCLLSLHRAEGFGFGPAEMMFLGKPVIATGWSGNMEFMSHLNSFPVNYELKPLNKPLGAYAAGLDWAEPDIEHAVSCLLQVVENNALALEVGKRAQHTMRTNFSPEAIGRQYRDRLAWISARL
jgi:glycosyltransferase involved in cell wall biosynthesis